MTKNRVFSPTSASVLIAGLLISFADAAVNVPLTVSNFKVTANSMSFDITGTISGPVPADNFNQEFLFVTTGLEGTDFLVTVSNIRPTVTGVLLGDAPLMSTQYFVENGGVPAADRISIGFNRRLLIGDTIVGSIALTAIQGEINVQAFRDEGFAIHWGRAAANTTSSPFTGTFQTSGSVVPEPSGAVMVSLAGVFFCMMRQRRSGAGPA